MERKRWCKELITQDVHYFKPATIEEATYLYNQLQENGKQPVYYAGGTEIITLARSERLVTNALIDIKSIPECSLIKKQDDEIIFGAALSLTKVIETNLFPLLNQTIAQIADQTSRNKITLGGNICGDIFYREATLPFLITDSTAVIASKNGIEEHPFTSIFNRELQLSDEDLLIQVKVKKADSKLPFYSVKKRKQWDVGYPLITAVAVKKKQKLKVAFSGLCNYPFHKTAIDHIMNQSSLTSEKRVATVLDAIPSPILNDVHGSAAYRHFVLQNILEEIVIFFEGEKQS